MGQRPMSPANAARAHPTGYHGPLQPSHWRNAGRAAYRLASEVVGVESQPPEMAVLEDCFLAEVAYPDHVIELAMFDKLPLAARMAVGKFFTFFLTGSLGDAEREKLHLHMQAWFVRQCRFR